MLTVNSSGFSEKTGSETPTSHDSQEMDVKKSLMKESIFRDYLKIENDSLTREPTLVVGIRVPCSQYLLYRKMDERRREVVREAMKQFFTSLVLNIDNTSNINVVSSNYNFNVNINVNNVGSTDSQSDVWTEERIKQLKEKLREANEVLKEYKVKVAKYDKVLHLVRLYKQGTIDAKTFLTNILQFEKE